MRELLAALFQEQDYKHQLKIHRGEISSFWGSSRCSPVLAERRKWIDSTPELNSFESPEAVPLLAEATALLRLPEAISSCRVLGTFLEPDFLLLKKNESGAFQFVGGSVCFPSSWKPEEKFGKPLAEIHSPVPHLNEEIGTQIHLFLQRLRPGHSWERYNWGLSRSSELNQHPVRKLPPLLPETEPGDIWVRIEHQSLLALPVTTGILFGIRIVNVPLLDLLKDSQISMHFARMLRTMPEEMARYKGILAIRPNLLRHIASLPQLRIDDPH
ncbi:MAG: DUF3445 domain-containing protein [Verrucomicrobiota bacterium]|nr:DUF3445 domain-containing protein [Verrucomicrobiota bacterium]